MYFLMTPTVTPRQVTNSSPIFVTLNYFSEGHYDYAVPSGLIQQPHVSNSCSCGVNAKLERESCVSSMSYQSRCKCFKSLRKCTENVDAKIAIIHMVADLL